MGNGIGFEPIHQLIGVIRELLGETPLSAQLFDNRGGPLDVNNLLLWVRVKPERASAVQEHGERTVQVTQRLRVGEVQVVIEALEVPDRRDSR